MKKICLTVVGICIMFTAVFAQVTSKDTTAYKSEKLKLDEVNLVSGYYQQTGDHSAVTGGIGTQKLNDVSNIIELKFVKFNNTSNNKYTIDFEAGIDHHTAASQAYISKSGASSPSGTRVYPSVNWKVEKANKTTIGFGAAYSGEYNYHSFSLNFQAGKTSKDNSREVTFKGQAFFDKVTLIEPSELIPAATQTSISTYTTASGNTYTSGGEGKRASIPSSSRNTYSGSLTLSQIINKNFQVALITDAVAQNGFLSLPFHRVYFNDGQTEKIENLPNTRFKIPPGIKVKLFYGR